MKPPKLLFLDKEELFIMVGMLYRVMLAMEDAMEKQGGITFQPDMKEPGTSEEQGPEDKIDPYQEVLDMLALLLPHITKDKELEKECNTYIALRYGIVIEDEPSPGSGSRRPNLRLVT